MGDDQRLADVERRLATATGLLRDWLDHRHPHGFLVGETRAFLNDTEPAESRRARICGLCGHVMTMTSCGSAQANGVPLCHTDDHDCYHRWTVYGARPAEPAEPRQPVKCPVCNGQGTVSRPPWTAGDQETWATSSVNIYKCCACDGSGLVSEAAASTRDGEETP